MSSAVGTCHKLCGDVGGKGSGPRRVTFENERFVTKPFIVADLQLGIRLGEGGPGLNQDPPGLNHLGWFKLGVGLV